MKPASNIGFRLSRTFSIGVPLVALILLVSPSFAWGQTPGEVPPQKEAPPPSTTAEPVPDEAPEATPEETPEETPGEVREEKLEAPSARRMRTGIDAMRTVEAMTRRTSTAGAWGRRGAGAT